MCGGLQMGVQDNITLQELLEQDYPDRLAEASLVLAREVHPDIDIYAYLQQLQGYAVAVSERLSPFARLGDVLFHLNDYLFNDCRFSTIGLDSHCIERNYLHHVIDNRCAAPLSMAIIYLTVGRWLGLPLRGMLLPGRTLVVYRDEDGEVVIDPGDGGLSLPKEDLAALYPTAGDFNQIAPQQPGHFLPSNNDKSLIVRLLHELKQAYMSKGNLESALWALEKTLELVPNLATGFLERGNLYELLDCNYAAAMDYSRYLELLPDASDASLLRKRLPELLYTTITLH